MGQKDDDNGFLFFFFCLPCSSMNPPLYLSLSRSLARSLYFLKFLMLVKMMLVVVATCK
jgi:hypothetical protein